jgi:shikimate kinase
MRIFLIGFMGSGKTHWGKQLAAHLMLPFFDLDECIIEQEKKTVAEIFSTHGEEYFRRKERTALEALSETHPSMILSCGGGTPCFFNNIGFMKKNGTVVWLNTPVESLLKRLLNEKTHRPLIKDIPDEELKTYIIRKLNERRMYYEQADVVVSNENNIALNELIQIILHA